MKQMALRESILVLKLSCRFRLIFSRIKLHLAGFCRDLFQSRIQVLTKTKYSVILSITMSRSTTIINISAPPKLAKEIERQAKKESKTKSELLRDAFESYLFDKRLRELQAYGRVVAEKLELESYDDIEEYFG